MASTSRRQSSFAETRGKRQQFDVECISSDDDDADDDPGVGQCRPVDVNVPVCKERDVLTVDAAKVRRVRRAVINGRAVESRSFEDEQMESKKSQGAPGVLFQSQETCGSLRTSDTCLTDCSDMLVKLGSCCILR